MEFRTHVLWIVARYSRDGIISLFDFSQVSGGPVERPKTVENYVNEASRTSTIECSVKTYTV